jgi:hypothetical protein
LKNGQNFIGGKLDDTTVILAQVVLNSNTNTNAQTFSSSSAMSNINANVARAFARVMQTGY